MGAIQHFHREEGREENNQILILLIFAELNRFKWISKIQTTSDFLVDGGVVSSEFVVVEAVADDEIIADKSAEFDVDLGRAVRAFY